MTVTPVYLDNAATTPCDPRVVAAMTPYIGEMFGNPACRHAFGAAASDAVERARGQAAALIGADAAEIVWTAGATESNNLAIKGVAACARDAGRRRHVVTSAFEHKAVLNPCRRLEEDGFEVTFLDPGPGGVITAEQVEAALRPDTGLVSIIAVNNEIGTVSELRRIGDACRRRGVLFHTDATQAIGLATIDVDRDGVDLLSWSGHKIAGPKGAGGLYVRSGVELRPVIEGGGHERGLRAGTLNVPGIVGLGEACRICAAEGADEAVTLRALRDRLESGLETRLGELAVNGDRARRAPHISNVCFPSVAGRTLIEHVDGVACSSGAAIGGGAAATSHVLRAIGVEDELAKTSLRLSLGRGTTRSDIDLAVERIASAVERLR